MSARVLAVTKPAAARHQTRVSLVYSQPKLAGMGRDGLIRPPIYPFCRIDRPTRRPGRPLATRRALQGAPRARVGRSRAQGDPGRSWALLGRSEGAPLQGAAASVDMNPHTLLNLCTIPLAPPAAAFHKP